MVIDHVATGNDVRGERESRGKSLRLVAREVGISAPYLSDLERGRRNWTEELFDKIKEVL